MFSAVKNQNKFRKVVNGRRLVISDVCFILQTTECNKLKL